MHKLDWKSGDLCFDPMVLRLSFVEIDSLHTDGICQLLAKGFI